MKYETENFNTTLATRLADYLKSLDIDEILVERPYLGGICSLVKDSYEALNIPKELCELINTRLAEGGIIWTYYPNFSGSHMFPIPAPVSLRCYLNVEEVAERSALAYQVLPKWTGEYGAARLEALQWLIEYLYTNPDCLSVNVTV